MVRFLIQIVSLLLVLIYAWKRGGRPEKIASAAMVADLAIDQLYHALWEEVGNYAGLDTWHFSLDCILLAVFVSIGLRSERLWPVWLAGAQLLTVLGHLLRAVDAQMSPLVYAVLDRGPFWMAIAIIAIFTRSNNQRGAAEATS